MCPGKEPYTTVRPAHEGDLDKVMEIVSEVVPEMNNAGNFQWDSVYPLRINFEEDVKNKNLYVVVEVDKGTENVLGMAALTEDQSPEYADCGTCCVDLIMNGIMNFTIWCFNLVYFKAP